QMVEHGVLLFPLENGSAPMYKPPLFHWTATALDHLAGIDKVTAFNLRAPSALYATAGVILTMVFAYGLLGASGGALAGLILVGSYQYVSQGRIGRVDMTLCFFETLALFTFIWWYAPRGSPLMIASPPNDTRGRVRSEMRGPDAMRYLLALALGFGVLAKGPVGAILPGLACFIFLIGERRLGDLRRLVTPGPVVLALALGSSWYLACFFARRYGFLDRQIGSENFGRFFGALGTMRPWYYAVPILINSAPMSLLAPIAIFAAIRSYWSGERVLFAPGIVPAARSNAAPGEAAGMPEPGGRRAAVAMRLLAIFWIVTVVFFSIAAYKRRAYLLPLWPATAVVLAWWLTAIARRQWGRILRDAIAAACAVLVVVFFAYLPYREMRQCGRDSFREAAAHINRVVGRNEPLYIYGLIDEPAPLLFYLDRSAPRIGGKLGDAPPGYVITPVRVWNDHRDEALDLEPVYQSDSGKPPVVLLRHGKAYAIRRVPRQHVCGNAAETSLPVRSFPKSGAENRFFRVSVTRRELAGGIGR
ncbi:MAG: ArnT family glycosyltransferase, partial [Candidatus Binataceae bacterium]